MKKTILKTTLAIVTMALVFTGCEINGDENHKEGVSCEDEGAVKLLKRIVDRKFNGDYKIEKNNIVIWDYNTVGRYTCRAKIKKVGEQKTKKTLSKDNDALAFSVMAEIFAPAQYGISKDGGWVKYYTYETTTKSLYVEIFSDESKE